MDLKKGVERLPKTLELVCEGDAYSLDYIDERLLPSQLVIARAHTWSDVVDAVKELAIRGAPAIGIAGAAAVVLASCEVGNVTALHAIAEQIATARPTAVNLRWGVNCVMDEMWLALREGVPFNAIQGRLADVVWRLECEDERVNRAIGELGAALLPPNARIVTHCNAGSLATYYYGTALGVVYAAAHEGGIERVYADETRPVGQGARLTAWELARCGVPVTLICDNMAASLMAQGRIDAVIVGADRIARNGDFANKIGTYGLAVCAHAHGVPFYVAAPRSTFDPELLDGSGIVIEQRSPAEVLPVPIEGVEVWNPAFDVTPARYVTKFVTEMGVFAPHEVETQL